jgi:hypothetical protein
MALRLPNKDFNALKLKLPFSLETILALKMLKDDLFYARSIK